MLGYPEAVGILVWWLAGSGGHIICVAESNLPIHPMYLSWILIDQGETGSGVKEKSRRSGIFLAITLKNKIFAVTT